jgi:hypothetical protein
MKDHSEKLREDEGAGALVLLLLACLVAFVLLLATLFCSRRRHPAPEAPPVGGLPAAPLPS